MNAHVETKQPDTIENLLYKIRRKADNKFLSNDGNWSEEGNAKIYFNDYSVTFVLRSKFFMGADLDDYEIVYYMCNKVNSKWASEWDTANHTPTMKRIREANRLRNFLVAIIMNGEYKPRNTKSKHIGETIPIPKDEDGWVLVENLQKIPFHKHALTTSLLHDIIKFGTDKRFSRIVFNKEEDKVKIIEPKEEPKEKFIVYGPTEADKEAIKTGNITLDPTNFPKEVIGKGIINTQALQKLEDCPKAPKDNNLCICMSCNIQLKAGRHGCQRCMRCLTKIRHNEPANPIDNCERYQTKEAFSNKPKREVTK